MNELDVDLEQKNIVGSIDRSIVNFGLVFIAVIPTYFQLILSPKKMVPLLRSEAADARMELKLGPGITFVFTILVLLGVGYVLRGTANPEQVVAETSASSSGIRSAVGEGNLWRSIILLLPLYFAALLLGVLVHLSHLIIRKKSDLAQAVGVGLYTLSMILILIIPISTIGEKIEVEIVRTNLIFAAVLLSIFGILPWHVFSFSRHAFGNSNRASAAAAIICVVVILLALVLVAIGLSSADLGGGAGANLTS